MTQSEVLSWAQTLPPPEQLQLIRDLAANLPRVGDTALMIEPGQEYAIWSPDSSYNAAATLLTALGQTDMAS